MWGSAIAPGVPAGLGYVGGRIWILREKKQENASSSSCRTTCTLPCSHPLRCSMYYTLLLTQTTVLLKHTHCLPLDTAPHIHDLQVNVMPFDPQRGADHARGYATKYASKPEIVGGINCLLVSP